MAGRVAGWKYRSNLQYYQRAIKQNQAILIDGARRFLKN
jgi:hypothetical protein